MLDINLRARPSGHRRVAPPRPAREQQEGATADARAWPVAEAASTSLRRTTTGEGVRRTRRTKASRALEVTEPTNPPSTSFFSKVRPASAGSGGGRRKFVNPLKNFRAATREKRHRVLK